MRNDLPLFQPSEPPFEHQTVFLEAARGIVERLREQAIQAADGSVTWHLQFRSQDELRRANLGPLLYPGITGVALFLAAWSHVSATQADGALALQALQPLRREVAALRSSPSRAQRILHPIGAFSGIGSLIYALLRIGQLLDRPDLLEDCLTLSTLITRERIEGDRSFDVMYGAAGAVLSLVKLEAVLGHQASGKPASGGGPLDRAHLCALHLLAHRGSPEDGDLRSWPWSGRKIGQKKAGFPHSTEGICHALLQLYGRTGDPALQEAAREGLASALRGEPEEPSAGPSPARGEDSRRSWCSGSSGRALSLLGSLDLLESPGFRQDLHALLLEAGSPALGQEDFLCCGNLGRVDALIHAHQKLGDARLLEMARSIARSTLLRTRESGDFNWMPGTVFDPRFFLGLSGVGYTFLRLAFPDTLPCVLVLE